MSSISSILVDQLESYGIPLQNASKVTGMFTGNIVTLALRLVCVSLLAGFVRSWFHHWRLKIHNALFPTAHIADELHGWTLSYLAKSEEAQRQLKQYKLLCDRNTHYSVVKKTKKGRRPEKHTFVEDGYSGKMLPVYGLSIRITVNGKWLWLSTHAGGFADDPNAGPHFRISTWFWNHRQIRAYTLEAYKLHHEKSSTLLNIYNHTPNQANWETPVLRLSRPWSSVILPGTIKQDLLKDVKGFISEEEIEWYTSKGIPHRRGYLLHGPPGTGKTTLATALASTLELDLYCINPAGIGMNNSKLQKCFRNCPPGSMILIEDIDCVMPINRATQLTSDKSSEEGPAEIGPNEGTSGKKDLGPSTVTLSGLLNAIDGVSSQEDSVLFASTNYPDRLDEALRRPGRFDVHVAFHHAVTEQAIDLYKHFYPLSRIQNDHPTEIQEKDHEPTTSHPFKDQSDLDRAAEQFAERIMGKNIKVSIATIQGFLLLYKKDPVMALEKVDEWAEGIRRDQFPDSHEQVENVVVEEEGSAEDMIVEEEDSAKEEIVEQEEAKVEAQKEMDEVEVEEPEPEKSVNIVGEAEKQEAVQEVVLA